MEKMIVQYDSKMSLTAIKQASARASVGKVEALLSIANFQKRMENSLMRLKKQKQTVN